MNGGRHKPTMAARQCISTMTTQFVERAQEQSRLGEGGARDAGGGRIGLYATSRVVLDIWLEAQQITSSLIDPSACCLKSFTEGSCSTGELGTRGTIRLVVF
ncbi:hypothetical protein SUGI_0451100 [Cryptomeria japonica]|nr:hypothetical protein SUGI_0451100 [Cryptomeria japonica]